MALIVGYVCLVSSGQLQKSRHIIYSYTLLGWSLSPARPHSKPCPSQKDHQKSRLLPRCCYLLTHLSGMESHPEVLCWINVVVLNSAGAGLPHLWRNPILGHKNLSLITDSLEPNTIATRNSRSEILFQGQGRQPSS